MFHDFDPRSHRQPRRLTFSPLAWLKLQFFCHAGPTEVGGFGVSRPDDLLYVEDFLTVRQDTSPVSVRFDDNAVAGLFDACVDRGLRPAEFSRIWLHTHPGRSARPSGTDEATFARCFGGCDWAVMFILGRTARTTARLAFHVGPGGSCRLGVRVDWSAWPALLAQPGMDLASLQARWSEEFQSNVRPLPIAVNRAPATGSGGFPGAAASAGWEDFWPEPLEDRPDAFDPLAR
jgi:proteasome lid subunit RPN8/RPN11